MNFICIANNIVGNDDGIGKHARIVGHELINMGHRVDYCSGTTTGKGTIGKVLSLQMTKAFLSAIVKMLKGNYDYVIIEYPFAEYNPIILLAHWLLFFVSRFIKTRIAFSMHEYDRVKPLRRKIIEGFLPFCDILFVTEEKYRSSLHRYAYKMYIRSLASQGVEYVQDLKDYNGYKRYCYFGLVNRSKAFQEMLDAWKIFNKEGKYYLDIVSNTDLSDYHLNNYPGITYYSRLSDEDAGKQLSKAIFSIIPVVPSIGYNNSSFVSTIQCGCIPIGKFNDDLRSLPFVISCDDYDANTFVKALEKSLTLSRSELDERRNEALEFGKRFSVHHTAEMMVQGFKDYEIKHKK